MGKVPGMGELAHSDGSVCPPHHAPRGSASGSYFQALQSGCEPRNISIK